VASHFGGTRDPLIVHWPKGIKAKNEMRTQFHHVIDICPTVLEAIGVPQPEFVNGTKQRPIEGVSILYSFDDAKAKGRRPTQYFEMFGNRAIYHEGWTACARHSIPWDVTAKLGPFDKDVWELYNIDKDFSQFDDLAAKEPVKLKELQELFLKEAVKYNVLPLDDRRIERLNPEFAGRPDLMGKRKKLTVYEGMTGMMENTFINTKNVSYSITAEVEIPKDGGNGVILAQGGRFAGFSLYMKEGKVKFAYNWLDAERYTIAATEKVPAGKATIRYEFAYDGGPPGSGGVGTIFVNDKKVAEGKIANTVGYAFGLDEGADVGVDQETPVTEDYPVGIANSFNGRIRSVTIQVK
jgi:arylsulfatase